MANKESTTTGYYEFIEDYNYISSDSDALIEANAQLALLNEASDGVCTDLFERLARMAEYHDGTTDQHTKRVGILSARISIRLGMPTEFTELIHKAAYLHDLGKVAIPDAILLKPTSLTADEQTIMQSHCEIGAGLLSKSAFPILQMAERIALSHHEKLDGSGYPHNLMAKDIPIEAKIVAVADVYDALSHERPYKHAWKQQEIIDLLVPKRGIHFDADIIDVLVHILK